MAKLQMSLKARALKYLSAREHSRLELARKLARYAQEGDDVEALLDFLEAAKFLSQTRFAESLAHRRASRYGNNRIFSELHSHGIDSTENEEVREQLALNETARAQEVWRKRFGQAPIDSAARAKQMRFLQQRGFSHAAIRAVMRAASGLED